MSLRPRWRPHDELEAAKAMSGASALVPWFLMASYLYYCRDESLMRDAEYDALCRELLMQWDHAEHRHKHLVDRDALRAGSAYHLREEDYPGVVRGAAERLLRMAEGAGTREALRRRA